MATLSQPCPRRLGLEKIPSSRLIPQLDFQLLSKYVTRTDQPQAIREYRDALRGSLQR